MRNSRKSYLEYAAKSDYEPQSIYLHRGEDDKIIDELKSRGARRVLIMSTVDYLGSSNVDEFIKRIEAAGLRVFKYIIKQKYSNSNDIKGALGVYLEFNCDTIAVFGGAPEIYCAKMVSAMAVNDISEPKDLDGYGKIKNDISLICCIAIDNSTAISSNKAEFYDEKEGRVIESYSNYLVPQVIVIDTDIAMRALTRTSLRSAFNTLAIAIECCLSPASLKNPVQTANALTAVSLVVDNIMRMKADPDDGFYRKKIMLAGISAGTALRRFGPGLPSLIVRSLKSLDRIKYGDCRNYIMMRYLEIDKESIISPLFAIYSKLVRDEVCPYVGDMVSSVKSLYTEEESASMFIEITQALYNAVMNDGRDKLYMTPLTDKEIRSVIEDIRKSSQELGLGKTDDGIIEKVLTF